MPSRYVKNVQLAAVQLAKNDVWFIPDSGVPTNGASGTGAGMMGPGSLYFDTTGGITYQNIGTKALPVWVASSNAVAGLGGDSVLRSRQSVASINSGGTLLPAIAGWKYRINDMTMIAIGGAASGATAVVINGVQATLTVGLLTTAIAALIQSTVVRAGAANAVVLTDGLSFVANDVNTAITFGKTGGNLATSTFIDFIVSFSLEK